MEMVEAGGRGRRRKTKMKIKRRGKKGRKMSRRDSLEEDEEEEEEDQQIYGDQDNYIRYVSIHMTPECGILEPIAVCLCQVCLCLWHWSVRFFPTTNGGMQNGSSVVIHEHCMHVFCTFGANLYAQSVLINEISAMELCRKFIKSVMLVGLTSSCCQCQVCLCHKCV